MLLRSFLLLLCATHPPFVTSFTATPQLSRRRSLQLFETQDDDETVVSGSFDPKKLFPGAEMEEFKLLPHRPLGMTIEESLADSRFVLVTKLVDGGHASQAGIQVGDVLVGITGLFGDLTNVVGLEVESIKGMVGSRPEDEALQIQIVRGTNAFDEHEKKVIELCSTNDATDKEIEACVVDYLSYDYKSLDAKPTEEEECDVDDPDADCLVDNLFDMWAEELPPPAPIGESDVPIEQPKQVPKPWSSRSSPSGTFVRDPVTGEMKNIG